MGNDDLNEYLKYYVAPTLKTLHTLYEIGHLSESLYNDITIQLIPSNDEFDEESNDIIGEFYTKYIL